jgi:hypothetical protein
MVQSRKSARKNSDAGRDPASSGPQETASVAYDVFLSTAAEASYEGFYSRAVASRDRGETTSQHLTALNMIDEAIERIIPHDPLNKKYALQGDLSGIFRMKKGRLGICWMARPNHKAIFVIFISETLRKAEDANAPHRLVTKMMMSGECDEILEALGLEFVDRKTRTGKPRRDAGHP